MHRSVTFTMAGSNVAVPKATAALAPSHKRHRTGMMYDTPEKFEAYYGIALILLKKHRRWSLSSMKSSIRLMWPPNPFLHTPTFIGNAPALPTDLELRMLWRQYCADHRWVYSRLNPNMLPMHLVAVHSRTCSLLVPSWLLWCMRFRFMHTGLAGAMFAHIFKLTPF